MGRLPNLLTKYLDNKYLEWFLVCLVTPNNNNIQTHSCKRGRGIQLMPTFFNYWFESLQKPLGVLLIPKNTNQEENKLIVPHLGSNKENARGPPFPENV